MGCCEGCLPVVVWLVEVPVGDHVLALVQEGIAPADPHVPQDLVLCALGPPQPHLNVQYKLKGATGTACAERGKAGCKLTCRPHMYRRHKHKHPYAHGPRSNNGRFAEQLAAMILCSSWQDSPLSQGDFYRSAHLVHEPIEGLACISAASIAVLLSAKHEGAPSLQRRHLVGGDLQATYALSTLAQDL